MSGDPDSIPAAAPPLTAYTCSPGGRMDKCKKSANSFHPRHAFCTLFNTFRGGNFYFPVCFVHTARWSGIINILKCISLYKQKLNLFEVKIDNSQSQTNKDRMQMSNVPCTVYFPRQRFSHSLLATWPRITLAARRLHSLPWLCVYSWLLLLMLLLCWAGLGQGTGVSGGCCAPYRKIRSSAFPAHSKTWHGAA